MDCGISSVGVAVRVAVVAVGAAKVSCLPATTTSLTQLSVRPADLSAICARAGEALASSAEPTSMLLAKRYDFMALILWRPAPWRPKIHDFE